MSSAAIATRYRRSAVNNVFSGAGDQHHLPGVYDDEASVCSAGIGRTDGRGQQSERRTFVRLRCSLKPCSRQGDLPTWRSSAMKHGSVGLRGKKVFEQGRECCRHKLIEGAKEAVKKLNCRLQAPLVFQAVDLPRSGKVSIAPRVRFRSRASRVPNLKIKALRGSLACFEEYVPSLMA